MSPSHSLLLLKLLELKGSSGWVGLVNQTGRSKGLVWIEGALKDEFEWADSRISLNVYYV